MRALYTITSQTAQVRYAGNGVTTAFSVTFQFFEASMLRVRTALGSVVSEKVLDSDYTVTGGNGSTGTVTFGTAPATGTNVIIDLDVPMLQETVDLSPNGPLPAEDVEQGFDRVVTMVKQLRQELRAVPQIDATFNPDTDDPLTLPMPEAGKYLVAKDDETGWRQETIEQVSGNNLEYAPSWAGSTPRILRYRMQDRMSLTDFGITPDPDAYVDITTALENAIDAIANSNPSDDEQGPRLDLPWGLFKCNQIDVDTGLRSIRIQGAGRFATTIRAVDAQQDHIVRFTSTSSRVNWSETQIKGWLTTSSPTDFPTTGIICEGGTNDFHEMEFNRCRSGLWIKRGNRNRVWKTHFGFFNLYALKFGGIDNGTALNAALTGQSWSGNVATYTKASHGLDVGDVFTIAGSSPSGYNRTSAVVTARTTDTFSCVELVDPGASTVLGTVTASVSGGAAISETRVHESTFYSGASSQGLGSYAGVQIGLLTDCGATKIENCDGGSTLIGVEIVDDLNLGNQRGCGFLTLEDYTSGVNQDCGLWIKDNGSSLEARTCNFSADGVSSGDGVRVASINAAPSFMDCDWHRCARDGIRITDGYSVNVTDSRMYQIGYPDDDGAGPNVDVPGTGIHCVSGSAIVTVMGGVYDHNLVATTTNRQMNYAVRKASAFTGQVHIIAVEARNQLITDFSDQDPTVGTFKLYRAQRSGTLTMADDSFAIIPNLRTPTGTMIAFSMEGNPGATVPSFILQVRADASVAPVFMSYTDATNLVATTGALNGTTGTDGRFTASSNGTNLYVENRLGAARVLHWMVIAG